MKKFSAKLDCIKILWRDRDFIDANILQEIFVEILQCLRRVILVRKERIVMPIYNSTLTPLLTTQHSVIEHRLSAINHKDAKAEDYE